ncbi:MAG: hypothetical protein Q8O76_07620 [Chloroflexota bacterium]|nr:hypothetical protein [Chloroflexota bacterium]
MGSTRLFTDQELKEMGTLTLDSINEALDKGDGERARRLAKRMYKEFEAMHDLYCAWVTGLLSFIGRRYGDQVLEESLRESCESWIRPLMDIYAKADPRRRLQMLASGLKGHLQPMTIEEDDEKFTIMMQPCGSGGRLVLGGSYGPPRNFLRIKKPQLITYGQADFPAYCAHCPFQEILPEEWTGAPFIVTFPAPSDKIGKEPCRMYLYKDPKAIPPEIYRRVGNKKPA